MSYVHALKETETFVPLEASRSETRGGPSATLLDSWGTQWRVLERGKFSSRVLWVLGDSMSDIGVHDPHLRASGDTWGAPCAWMSSVRQVIDLRPALEDVAIRLQPKTRLRALRIRAQEKGLQVVGTGEEDTERIETNEAMRGLQAESLSERD